MKEFIDKLISRLEELYNDNDKMKKKAYEEQDWENFELFTHGNEGVKESIEIINELAEEYKVPEMPTGWIPCSERLPEDGVKVLCYGSNALGRMRYEVSCYSHKLRWWKCSVITDVFAWMPLPTAPYTEGE